MAQQQKKSQQPAKKEEASTPAVFSQEDFLETDDFDMQDIQIPFIRIAQRLSPQADEESSEYIEGCKPGMIFNTATGELYAGEEGVLVVPAKYRREYIEFKKRDDGGGFVGNHGSDDTLWQQSQPGEKGNRVTPEGNELVESATFYVLLINPETGAYEQGVIGMASSMRKTARQWSSLIRTTQVPGLPKGKVPAPYVAAYRLKPARMEKDGNKWYVWSVKRECLASELPDAEQVVHEAKNFRELIESGAANAAQPESQQAHDDEEVPF